MADGEPYFVGKDVATILGYERSTKAIRDHVDEEDVDEIPIQDSIGRMQNTPIINESGLYSLILSSKMPNAKKFKRWVTAEVLPTIRRSGSYGKPLTAAEQIRLIAQGNVELSQKVQNVEKRIDDLEHDMPLYGCEIDEIKVHINRKGINVLGGKQSAAYRDASIRSSVYSDMYRQLKREYGAVSSYKSIKRKYISEAHGFIDRYVLPRTLKEQIENINMQINFKEE